MAVVRQKATQGMLTPIPITIELPAAVRPARVLAHYKMWGAAEWASIELAFIGRLWIGAIPCLEVSTISGDISYYIRAHDHDGEIIAYSGSRARPYKVTIVHDSQRPGAEQAAGRCPDPADCPRGLPGCPSEHPNGIPCASDDDCEGEMICGFKGVCERREREENWLTVEAQQEFGILRAAGACTVASQETEGYACFRADGAQYFGNPVLTNEPLGHGFGNTRIVLGFERLIYYNTSLGLRAGYAFAGKGRTATGASSFVPVLGEARVSRWFGYDPFSRTGFRWYVFVMGGFASFDIPFSVRVREDPLQYGRQGGNDLEQTLDGWKRAGDVYVGLGAGTLFALTRNQALSGEIGVLQAFPFSATVITAKLGYRFGF